LIGRVWIVELFGAWHAPTLLFLRAHPTPSLRLLALCFLLEADARICSCRAVLYENSPTVIAGFGKPWQTESARRRNR
jgi:hypothetical protein